MTGELEELLKLEHEQRLRPDCPTGRANSLPVPEKSPTERAIQEGDQDGEPRGRTVDVLLPH
jgi:hypothetical protein